MKAMLGDTIIAESNDTIVLEGHYYFPPDSVRVEYLRKNGDTYVCSWKGTCDYYDVVVGDDMVSEGAAWSYPNPSDKAQNIAGWFAFWKDVEIEE